MYGADQELMLASLLYDAGIDENMWPHTLDRLNHVLGCDGVALALCSEDGSISHYQTGTAFRLDARRSRDAAMQRPRVHDLVAAETVCPGPEGTWRPRLDFRCIEFQSVTRDEADVQRAVAANRPPPGTLRCVFVVVRCAHRAPFANEDIALLQSLLPHVRRSLAIQLRHGATSAAESCALGVGSSDSCRCAALPLFPKTIVKSEITFHRRSIVLRPASLSFFDKLVDAAMTNTLLNIDKENVDATAGSTHTGCSRVGLTRFRGRLAGLGIMRRSGRASPRFRRLWAIGIPAPSAGGRDCTIPRCS